MAKNYYDILGVDRKATQDDVKKAFRKLAQKHHPDKGGDEAKFKEITEAYSILSDEKRRREYDSYGQTFPGGQGAPGGGFDPSQFSGFGGGVEFDISDIFGDLFGTGGARRAKRGRDISIDIEITFKESVFGATRSVLLTKVGKCETCTGTGAKPGTEMETCKACNGVGRIHETRQSIMGPISIPHTCSVCEGTGKIPKEKCKTCAGNGVLRREEEIKLEVPAGVDNGEMMRLLGQGEAVKAGTSGDLYVKIHVKPHAVFKKEGLNLIMALPVKLTDALLGTSISVTMLDDKVIEVKVPAMDKVEETLRVRGKGIASEGNTGDLLIHLSATLPRKLSTKSKKVIEELKNEGL